MAKEEITHDLPKWWTEQPTQKFEVTFGDHQTILVDAHEVNVGSPQPILSFLRYESREIEVTKTTGKGPNLKEEVETKDHPLVVYAASFNAGAWISFRDVESTEVPEVDGE
jgi:hypothetical protein